MKVGNVRIRHVAKVLRHVVAGQPHPLDQVFRLELARVVADARPFQREIAALRSAGVTRVAIVPLFISSHSEHFDQLRYLVGMRDSLDATTEFQELCKQQS